MNAIDDATKSPTARARPDIPALQAITANGLSLVAAGGAEPAVDIVFIHGLQGHPEHTWTYEEDHVTQHEDKDSARKGHSLHTFRGIFSAKQRPRPGFSSNETGAPSVAGTNRCFWPSTLLARDLPNARIFTYGYDSSVTHFFFGAANKSTITDNGRSFLQSIVSKRTHCPGRPLIFIAHSLGGLVVKAALLQASRAGPDDDDYCDVLASTIAIMFFGTPHRGSEWVDQGQILRKFASAFGFSTSQYNLKLLRRDSEMLELLRDEFARLLQTGSFRVTSFYETVGFKGLKGFDKLIVEKADACIDHPSYERKLPISENHVGMCKFGTMGGRNAEYNEKVKAEIDLHLKRHQRNIEQKCLQSLRCFYDLLEVRAHEIESPYTNTLSWMLYRRNGPGLHDWLSKEAGIFWIQGLPGSGKSTAMKWLSTSGKVRSILQSSQWDVGLVFYTDRKSSIERSWKGVLASMLYQLLKRHPELLHIPVRLLRDATRRSAKHRSSWSDLHPTADMYAKDSWTVEVLEECLMHCKIQTTHHFRTCFFVDALDENDSGQTSRERILKFLSDVASPDDTGCGQFKIVAASRPENDIELKLSKCQGTLKMQEWTMGDIETYVTSRLDAYNLRYRQSSAASQGAGLREIEAYNLEKIRMTVVNEARGVFIWVRIVMDQVTESITDGVSLEEILEELLRMPRPDRGLSDFYRRILSRVPPAIKGETFVFIESVLRAERPLTVFQLALLWETERHRQSSSLSDARGFNIGEGRIFTMSNSGTDWERRIRRASGGLLQLRGPPHISYDSSDIISDLRAEAGNELSIGSHEPSPAHHLSAVRDAVDEIRSDHPGGWSVQFLHQTVKEFFQDSRVLQEYLSPGDEDASLLQNGHSFILAMNHSWLLLPRTVRRGCGHEMTFEPTAEIPHHAFLAESTLQRPFVTLLMSLDQLMAEEYGDYWIDSSSGTITWKINLMAFAVGKNMRLFVQTAVTQYSHLLFKRGRPLLHFTAWSTFNPAGPHVEMAKLLLDVGVQVNAVFQEKVCAKTALESMQYYFSCDELGGAPVEFIKLLVTHGARLPGKIIHEHSWETILHAVVGMRIIWPAKFGLIRLFVDKGVSLNETCSKGKTVLDKIVLDDLDVPVEDYLWMLHHGSQITSLMVEKIYVHAFYPSRLGNSHSSQASQLASVEHPLRHIDCRQRGFYERKAARMAKRYNPQWPGRWRHLRSRIGRKGRSSLVSSKVE